MTVPHDERDCPHCWQPVRIINGRFQPHRDATDEWRTRCAGSLLHVSVAVRGSM